MKSCAFAGHRPEKMPWGNDENTPAAIEFKFRLREALEYLIGRGYTDFLSGGSRRRNLNSTPAGLFSSFPQGIFSGL